MRLKSHLEDFDDLKGFNMASPQRENGFTPIANEIMEALARIRVPGEARQVLDCIMRKTYGFNKKSDDISLSQIILMTGLHKASIIRARKILESMNMISVSKLATSGICNYRFNKDFDTWKPLAKMRRGVAISLMGGRKFANKSVANLRHTKEIKKYTKEREALFVEVLTYFNEKTGKNFRLTNERRKIIESAMAQGRGVDEFKKVVDNFCADDWPERPKYMDIKYAFGTVHGIDNFEKWLYAGETKGASGVLVL